MISNKSSFAGLNGKSVGARYARSPRARHILWQLACVLLIAVGASFFYTRHASAANVTWDGGGTTNNWSEAANWSGDTVPGSSDIVFFDGTSTKDATIDVSINVRGMQINSGYTGMITQAGSSTITIGDFGYTQNSGSFNGGSGDIGVTNEFDLHGGTFTSTTGTLFLGFSYDHGGGGTFNHNNGTVTFDATGGGSFEADLGAENFNNVNFNDGNGQTRTIFGGPVVVLGALAFNDGIVNGNTIEGRAAVTIGPNFDGGQVPLTFSGSANQTFTNNGGANPTGTWTINKPTGKVMLASDLILNGGQALNITSGTLDQGASSNLQTSNTLTIGANGTLRDFGTGDLTLGGDLNDSGIVNLNGGGTGCSDPNASDPLQLRSTNATQRTWSGGGTFSLVDVDVDTQTVGATPGTITAFGISHLNNTSGFVLDTGCPLVINAQPGNQAACPGGSANFSVNANGASAFQWRKDGTPLSDEPNHTSGTTNATLTINPVGAGDVASYDVVVTSSLGITATSNAATLTLNTPDLAIDKSHNGNFTVGTNGTYTLTVTDVGTCSTTGMLTVTDTLPAGLSFVSGTGTGWNCSANGQNVTCTNAGPLAPSAASAITLTVGVAQAAVPSVINTATVSTPDDANAANNSDSDPTTVNNSAPPLNPGDLIISEFRLRGPGGTDDEFVEAYNNTNADITVSTTDASAGFALFASDGLAHYIIPNGTMIPARGHYLLANSNGYSLSAYAAADHDAQGNNLSTSDGIALFSTSASPNPANLLDAVGFNTAPTLYREGAGLPFSHTGTASAQYAFVRKLTTGLPQDTDDNAADFVLVSVTGDLNGTPVALGAPGPENLASPVQRNAQIKASLIDPQCAGTSTDPTSACARVRDTTSDPANKSTFGTLSIRRKFTNNTGVPVTALRFRIVDITTLNNPTSGAADLRALNSVAATVTRMDNTPVTLSALTLEQPPAQNLGGGLNASLAVGVIAPAAPLSAGASVNVEFKLGVQATGAFHFFVNIKATTGAAGPAPFKKGRLSLKSNAPAGGK